MTQFALSDLTVCGVEELPKHSRRAVTHVLSLIDPDWPEITAFESFDPHHRAVFRFHDIIDPLPGRTPPSSEIVESVLEFGRDVASQAGAGKPVRLLIHCHMGVSRSSAAMLSFMAQTHRDEPVSTLYDRLRSIRPKSWPNSVMVGYIDDYLGFGGELVEGLRTHYGLRLQAHPATGEWMMANGRAREVEMALLLE
ncbi:protein-tyrosine-phosphatase [Thalassospiraceae bacterium LMO-JJ14]|nr:protein-tyrosine-phosphatase [Thalassospiraceae bacterium LMO-JJ14]